MYEVTEVKRAKRRRSTLSPNIYNNIIIEDLNEILHAILRKSII